MEDQSKAKKPIRVTVLNKDGTRNSYLAEPHQRSASESNSDEVKAYRKKKAELLQLCEVILGPKTKKTAALRGKACCIALSEDISLQEALTRVKLTGPQGELPAAKKSRKKKINQSIAINKQDTPEWMKELKNPGKLSSRELKSAIDKISSIIDKGISNGNSCLTERGILENLKKHYIHKKSNSSYIRFVQGGSPGLGSGSKKR